MSVVEAMTMSFSSNFGVGAGEGLAAVRGYQSGDKGMLAAMSAFSREIEMVCGLSVRFPAPTHFSE